MLRSPIFYAVLSFIASLIIMRISLPSLTCMDGWKSPSIGLSGACSHHGGINHIPSTIALIISLAIGFITWRKAKKHEDLLKSPKNKTIQKVEDASYSTLSSLNIFLCCTWNFLVRALCKLGLGKIFKKAPILTFITAFVIVFIYPPLTLLLYILAMVAYANDARFETGYLVPDKTGKP